MAAFVAHVGAECPGMLRDTPLDKVVPNLKHASFAEEVAFVRNESLMRKIEQGLEAVEQRPQVAAVQQFATTVASIRWSNPRKHPGRSPDVLALQAPPGCAATKV